MKMVSMPASSSPALDVAGLVKTYGSLRALDGVTLSVGPGEIFGFVGSNGAGKTTTMRIILGVLAADSGQVSWQGKPLDFSSRQNIGYMPEERGLYPKMQVGEQLVYMARLHGLTQADAQDSALKWASTLGVEARFRDEVQTLSLGNQQRVQLAAALVHNPQVLVLDEPFSGLDPVAVDVMSSVLRERAHAGVPVIFSSHQLDLVERLCDRVGIIASGKMVATGTIDQLRHADRPQWRVNGQLVDAPAVTAHAGPATSGTSHTSDTSASDTSGGAGLSEAQIEALGQEILREALALGPVHEFGQVKPSLTEIYRHVVTADSQSAHTDAPAHIDALAHIDAQGAQ